MDERTKPVVRVRRDGRGTWWCRLYLGRTPDGREIKPRRSFPGASGEAEALELARAWADGMSAGGRVRSMVLTDLLEEYVDTLEDDGVSPNSIRTYRLYAGRYCARALKGRRADELGALDFTRFARDLRRRGGIGGRPLSPATVRGALNFLRGAYGWFVRSGLLADNPLIAAERPRPEPQEACALDESDLAALVVWLDARLSLAHGGDTSPLDRARAMAMWLALHTGMRVGEVAALRRRDVYPVRGHIRVSGTVVCLRGARPYRKDAPKSASSRRNISLTPSEMEVICAYEKWQDGRYAWCSGSSPLVSVDGAHMRPDALSAAFARIRRRLGLAQRTTFHSLRHTHASWCLAEGIDLVTVSERLGHADPAFTARIYGHVLAGRDAAAAGAFDAAARRLGGRSGVPEGLRQSCDSGEVINRSGDAE